MDIEEALGDLERLIFVGPLRKAWNFFCLQGKPYNTPAKDYLEVLAAKENLPLEDYIRKHEIKIEPIKVKASAPFWSAMGFGYNKFSKASKEYGIILNFSERFGEKHCLGFKKDFFMEALGVKGVKTSEKAQLDSITNNQDLPPTIRLKDYLKEMSSREQLPFEEYVRKYDITLEPIRVDTIAPLDLAKKTTNKRFRDIAKNYHAITDLKEYEGETALFGLVREYIIMATGVKKKH
ncbi:MAG: hypothetical protein ABIB71_01565 [Candidatus Woesearchaeota archaeon]